MPKITLNKSGRIICRPISYFSNNDSFYEVAEINLDIIIAATSVWSQ